MPLLYLDGKLQGDRTPDMAKPCEWCGEAMAWGASRPVSAIFDGDRPGGVERAVVTTRLCQGCIDIYCTLGTDGLIERNRPITRRSP